MIDICIIIETEKNKNKTDNIITIAKKIGAKTIIPFSIPNISKEEMIRFGDIATPYANLESNDLDNMVKSIPEKRMLTFKEIKNFIEHRTAWYMLCKSNFKNAMIIDNTTILKKEYSNNFVEKIKELMENAPPLFTFLSLIDSGKKANRCNEYVSYPDMNELTQMAYIISDIGLKKMIIDLPLSPIKGTINSIINEIRLLNKDIFIMKNPIFNTNNKKIQQPIIQKQLSLPVKSRPQLFTKVFIVQKYNLDNDIIGLLSSVIQNENISYFKKETEEQVWKEIAEENDEPNNVSLVIFNNVQIDSKTLKIHLGLISREVPINFNFIGLPTNENIINHPFCFNKFFDFVHPDMHIFSGYLLTKKGATIFLKNTNYTNRNLMLAREHNCFAYKNKLFNLLCD